MPKKEIRFAGFGGQGIILSGNIAGKAAVLFEKTSAVLTQSYGPEARGGSCSADLIISDKEVDYPIVRDPTVLVIMSQDAYRTYGRVRNKDAMLIIDEDLVKLKDVDEGQKNIFKVPSTRIAEQDLGKKIVANIVMLGAFTAISQVVSYEGMKNAVLSSVPKGTEELNIKAFDKGYEYGKKVRDAQTAT